MPSCSITRYTVSDGSKRYRVTYRLGGRETPTLHGGSFRLEREARARRDCIAGELAAMRVPNLMLVGQADEQVETPAAVAERWRDARARINEVAAPTITTYGVHFGRFLPRLGSRPVDRVTPAEVVELVAELHERGLARESIRKTLTTLGMVFDFASVEPNPVRDKLVRLRRKTART
jgi:hypothetical protein